MSFRPVSYSIFSFNSSIPSIKKKIKKILFIYLIILYEKNLLFFSLTLTINYSRKNI
jgi:hypothetical protein